MSITTLDRRSLADQAADLLRHRIAAGDWPVGERIPPEAELTRLLGVSRNTLREAVRSLVHAGMLEVRQGDGTYVRGASDAAETMRRISRADLRHQIEVRCALEEAAARMAASRRDEGDLAVLAEARRQCQGLLEAGRVEDYIEQDFTFHQAIVAAARNPALTELYLYFSDSIRASIRQSIRDAELPEPSAAQHMTVLDAIVAGDGDGAAVAVRTMFAPLLAALELQLGPRHA